MVSYQQMKVKLNYNVVLRSKMQKKKKKQNKKKNTKKKKKKKKNEENRRKFRKILEKYDKNLQFSKKNLTQLKEKNYNIFSLTAKLLGK